MSGGRGDVLLGNLVLFARILRSTGLPVSPRSVADAGHALTLVDIERRDQVFHALRALMVGRREDLQLFETAFNRFWTASPVAGDPTRRRPEGRTRRHQGRFSIASLSAYRASLVTESPVVADRRGTAAHAEVLRRKRFAVMSADELDEARRLLAHRPWTIQERRSHRRVRDRRGPDVDLRRLLRSVGRTGSVPSRLPRRARLYKQRPVVLIADISGSMETQSRMILHLFHLLVRSLDRVETFVFATRLTRITRHLRLRNVDRAIDEAALNVMDWSGGTRIGESLGEFNRRWSRRLLGHGTIVVIVSDGCEGGDPELLRTELGRLRSRCRRLIWLHPHAGSARFEPRVAGLEAAMSYVDDFVPAGDVRSLIAFSDMLAGIRGAASGRRPARRPGVHRAPIGEGSAPEGTT